MLAMAYHRWDIAVACHSTAAAHTTCNLDTSGPFADGIVAYTEAASFEDPQSQDHCPSRRPVCRPALLVCSAQPADGGYSSCRPGMVFDAGCRPDLRLPHLLLTEPTVAEELAIDRRLANLNVRLGE